MKKKSNSIECNSKDQRAIAKRALAKAKEQEKIKLASGDYETVQVDKKTRILKRKN